MLSRLVGGSVRGWANSVIYCAIHGMSISGEPLNSATTRGPVFLVTEIAFYHYQERQGKLHEML